MTKASNAFSNVIASSVHLIRILDIKSDLLRQCIFAIDASGQDFFEKIAKTRINTEFKRVLSRLSKKDNFKLDERKRQAKDYIAELMQLTEREQEYMDRFIAKEYVPELLFDDKEIVERIKEHPMVLWKCQ